MKDLTELENRLASLKAELSEVRETYPYFKAGNTYHCPEPGITLRNQLQRKIANTQININQVKMQLMNNSTIKPESEE